MLHLFILWKYNRNYERQYAYVRASKYDLIYQIRSRILGSSKLSIVTSEVFFAQICSNGILIEGCTFELYFEMGLMLLFQPCSLRAILFNLMAWARSA